MPKGQDWKVRGLNGGHEICPCLYGSVFGALSEFDRNLIRERTQAGLSAARARGRKGGRPKRLDDKKRKLAVEMYRERKHSIEEICQMMGITKPTLYRYVRDALS